MSKPKFITFTGIDEHTNLYEAYTLQKEYPIEWGILCSENPKNNPRYPSFDFINYARKALGSMSIHLCGSISISTLLTSEMPSICHLFDRVQINAIAKNYNKDALRNLHYYYDLVIQHRDPTTFESPYSDFGDLLYDPSGGRGIHPNAWPTSNSSGDKLVGYAGGISENNVKELISSDAMKNQNYWIDMESSIRTNNLLDIGKCRRICEIVYDCDKVYVS
jgi:hypothetical protein